MRQGVGLRRVVGLVGASLGLSLWLISTAAVGEERPESQAEIIARLCTSNRPVRVRLVQEDTHAWFARIERVRAACKLTSTPTGAIIHDRNRSYPEMKSGISCPKGVPAGETSESAWGILATLEPGAGTTERITEAHDQEDELAATCESVDAKIGLFLRVYLSDLDALKKILAWKPAPSGAKSDAGDAG